MTRAVRYRTTCRLVRIHRLILLYGLKQQPYTNGSITTSNNITAGVNIYATDGLIKGKNLEITSTSNFTGAVPTNTINLSSITYNDSSGLDKLTIKGASTVEYRDKKLPLINVSSNANSGFDMNRHLLMNI